MCKLGFSVTGHARYVRFWPCIGFGTSDTGQQKYSADSVLIVIVVLCDNVT